MKKILSVLLLAVLMLPMIVKADLVNIKTYYNSKVMVDGEVEVHIPIDYITDYYLEITYDTNYLETSKDMITLSQPTSIVVENDDTKEIDNLFEVEVTSGKISIKASVYESNALIGDIPTPELNVKFKAIKIGTTNVVIGGHVMENNSTNISIVDKNCSNCPSCPEPEECNCPNCSEVEESNCPVCPAEKECNCEKTTGTENNDDNSNLWLYCSLGANALLLILLIVALISKKGKKEVKAEEPVVEHVEEPKLEPVETPQEENKEE